MLVKMRRESTPDEVKTVEHKLHDLGFKTGRMDGEEITLIGVYGDISKLPVSEIAELAGVEQLIPISRAYKRVAQKGSPEKPLFQSVKIGSVVCGGDDLAFIAGPCSVESEAQIMESARMVKEAGGHALRGGVVKYRSSPYSGWEGLGASDNEALRKGLELIVKAGRAFELPTVVEILDQADVPIYEDTGVDCFQIGEPNSKNQALLNRLRTTPLPVIHKRGNSLDTEAYLLWVERMMATGKENVILCERGIASANRYTRNTLDIGTIAAFRYQLSGLPIAVDASHGTGVRDLVHPATLAGIMAGASVVLVEAHPNPLIAKSDGHQGLFDEQLKALVKASNATWKLRQELDKTFLPSASLEKAYLARMEGDKKRLFRS
ncbi:MAG TPA: 3-deoxy-7-phosphoheptulonate synthase [Candidatus Binatia bacterium]|jgi:3-deoxy-7-phosphoheptulonate synthase|nr:3-deoxy-7-phosphoheptulonate synthase [Candidatus Binatia bacterium]